MSSRLAFASFSTSSFADFTILLPLSKYITGSISRAEKKSEKSDVQVRHGKVEKRGQSHLTTRPKLVVRHLEPGLLQGAEFDTYVVLGEAVKAKTWRQKRQASESVSSPRRQRRRGCGSRAAGARGGEDWLDYEEVDEGEVDGGFEEKDVDEVDAGEREQRESSGGVESERWGYRERNHGIDNVRRKT